MSIDLSFNPVNSMAGRVIRVFISSTFRDMQAERDYLVKFIFPQLRKLCESRGVTWGEVDLRWGVTDEQAAEGKVLPICLEEIKRCRPYFIGLLGERYGWVPESIPEELLEKEEWLREQFKDQKSVTELEILHGVLNDPKMAGHAFFYFRDPKYIETLSDADKKTFAGENTKNAEKLCTLKDKIRRSGFPVRNSYRNHEVVGRAIRRDLTRIINDTWPEGSQPEPLDREAMDHEAYAQSRERVYIGRQEYFDRLDTHAAANDTQPLVVLGESGSGKSALLANWVSRYRLAHPDALVLQHYIGATPYSADWAAMLRRLMGEFKRKLGLQQDIPDQPDALRSAFPNWLYMAAAKGRVVLVLDALNQLEDRDGAPDLVWLPPVLPENVRLIVSTLPGRPLDEIQKRHWPTLNVELLSADERRKLIAEHLAQHAKKLNNVRVERIATAPHSANPLYLRVLLDELRLVRRHEELEQRIADYLKAESPYALYEKVIARWEQDYEGDSDLVGDTLSLLWAARRGLTETELLQALGRDGDPLPRAKWSPLFLAMSAALISRGGLLTFAHDFLRTAVMNAFLPTGQNQHRAHLRLADYFERQSTNSRRTEELPWQLAEAHAWQRLHDLLSDDVFFVDAWRCNEFGVKTCWAQIEANSPLRLVDAYRSQIEGHEAKADERWSLWMSSLLSYTGHLDEAFCMLSNQVDHFRETGDLDGIQTSLTNLAGVLFARGDLDGAMARFKEAERICRQLGNADSFSIVIGNQATILQARGDLDGAMVLYKDKERICRQLGNTDNLATTLNNQAVILSTRGEQEKAMALLEEVELLCRQSGNLDSLIGTRCNQAKIFQARGDGDRAMMMFNDVERICRQLGNWDGLEIVLSNQASIFQSRGDLDRAMILYKEQEGLCRTLNKLSGLERTLCNQGLIMMDRGDLDGAMAMQKESERICRELGDLDHLEATIGNQALILMERGDLDGAMALQKESEQICRQLSNLDSLSKTLGNQANILKLRGDSDRAMEMFNEVESICRQLGNIDSLAITLNNQALILSERGDLDGVMELLKEAERICRQLGKLDSLAISLANQAATLKNMGKAREGLPLAEEAYQLASKHGYVALAGQFGSLLTAVHEAAQSKDSSGNSLFMPATPTLRSSPPRLREPTIPELRDTAANAMKRGLWEAATTYLEKLLQQGEPVQTVAPDLITALLNAHETVSTYTLTRIETLLQKLEQDDHGNLAAPLRQQLQAKLPRKKGWKFW